MNVPITKVTYIAAGVNTEHKNVMFYIFIAIFKFTLLTQSFFCIFAILILN